VRTLCVVTIKRLDRAKHRLSPILSQQDRSTLAKAMLTDVLKALHGVGGLSAVCVVSPDSDAKRIAAACGAQILDDPDEGGQSQAARIGIDHAQRTDHDRVLLAPADTPLIDCEQVSSLLAEDTRWPQAVVVPDRHHTGTNGLLLAPPDALSPSFGPDSLQRHTSIAPAGGAVAQVRAVSSLALDIDTPDDLAKLVKELDSNECEWPTQTKKALKKLLEKPVAIDPHHTGAHSF
jgi:2-phospho-L-lactate/phosphoenolpyruvate guanylyltransferase